MATEANREGMKRYRYNVNPAKNLSNEAMKTKRFVDPGALIYSTGDIKSQVGLLI
jgi:hypothetical protein